MRKPAFSFLLWDIRFWIILFFLLRLLGITDPPLEVAHNWRQTTVLMVSRNFFEHDANPLYPQLDIAGEKTGITGMEFPLLNYLVYLVARIFGYAHWYGRLINLLVSSLGIHFFYRLVKKYFGERHAFYSAFILLVSVWLNYSRKTMPDTFSTSLALMALWYGIAFLERGSTVNLVLFALTALAGTLSKLPAGTLFVLFAPFMVRSNYALQFRLRFALTAAGVCALTLGYYFYWVPHLNRDFGFVHFFMGKSLSNGFHDLAGRFSATAEKFYAEALGYTGFALFLFSAFVAVRRRQKVLLGAVAALSFSFLFVMLKSGSVFYNHAYYIVPFVPAMALLAGYGLSLPGRRLWAAVALLIIGAENIATRFSDYHINPAYQSILALEEDLDRFSKRSDLVLINSGQVPTPMYFAHRRGWLAGNSQMSSPQFIDSLRRKQLRYIVVLKQVFGQDMTLNYPVQLDKPAYRIYKVD